MAAYRILALDGGGIRGIIPTVILQRLCAEPALKGWLDRVDLVAGTSTGGLLALAIAAGMPLETIRTVYENKGGKIFDDSWLDNLKDVGKIMGADYDVKNLERELKGIFGDTTLAKLKKKVLITAFDLDNESTDPATRTWKPKLFHNYPGPGSDGSTSAYKAGVYTSAAPTYFESYDGYIDGGVYATNPSMCAVAQALDTRYVKNSLGDLVLLNVGTGTNLQYIKGASHDWGYAQWAKPLVALMLDGVSGIADYQCARLLSGRYHRLGPAFPPDSTYAMDEWRRVPEMIQFATKVDLGPTISFLKTVWL